MSSLPGILTSDRLLRSVFNEQMESPFQDSGDVQSHLSSHPLPFPESQALATNSSATMAAVGTSDSQTGMETAAGMSGVNIQSSQPLKDFNMALLCRIGQETVQEIVSKATELFQILRSMQPPNGTAASTAGQEDKKAKLQETLKYITACFKNLHKVYDKCNENCTKMEYAHMEVVSLIPFKDEVDSRQEDKKSTEALKRLTDEQQELVEAVTLKNRQLKEIIDHLRTVIWDINTMLAMKNS